MLFISTTAIAQKEGTLFNNSPIKLSGIWGGPINNLGDLGSDTDFNYGGHLVFEVNNDFLIGWTGYSDDFMDIGDSEVKMTGSDLLLGYTHKSDNTIHPTFYLQTGRGNLKVNGESNDRVRIFQPSVGAEANITRWFRAGVDIGYRSVSGVDHATLTNSDLSSAYVGLRLKFGWSWGTGSSWDDDDDDISINF